MSVVQFDVDGVLADFSSAYDRTCAQLGIPAPGPDAPWDSKWNERVWDVIRTSLTWYATMPSLVTDVVFRRIHYLGADHHVYFVTHRGGLDAKQQTEAWLEWRGIRRPTVIVTGKKGEFARCVGATFAIDDKAGNAVYTAYESPKTASYLIDRPYNRFDQTVLGTKVVRIASVEDFLDIVEAAL